MRIPFLDLSITDQEHKAELLLAVERMLDHGRIVKGPEVAEFETRIADRTNRNYAVGVSSGTDAVHLALRVLDIGPGDEVITTPLSWIATFNAIAACGATPVCVDIREDLNIDPALIEEAITPQTKAILPVHFTGHSCDMDPIQLVHYRKLVPTKDVEVRFICGTNHRDFKSVVIGMTSPPLGISAK